VAQDAALSRR